MNENFEFNLENNTLTILIPEEIKESKSERVDLSEDPIKRKAQLSYLDMTEHDMSYGSAHYREPFVIQRKQFSSHQSLTNHLNKLLNIQKEIKLAKKKDFIITNEKEFLALLRKVKKQLKALEEKKHREDCIIKARAILIRMDMEELENFIKEYDKK